MVDEKIVAQIRASLAEGKSKEEIYRELLGQGLTLDAIEAAFFSIASEGEREETSKRLVRVVVAVGATLVGFGVFSFIAANWDAMTRPMKLATILLSMLVAYGAGWYLREHANAPKTGGALIVLGSVIYGAGIFLVGQMFHIRAPWPDGLILWMLGTIAMAFAVSSYALFSLAIAVGIASLISFPIFVFSDIFGFGGDPFLLTSSLLLLVATIVTLFAGWRVRKRIPPDLRPWSA